MTATPESLSSRRLRFWLPWVSALVFVAGLVTFLIVYNVGGIRNTAHVYTPRPSNKPPVQPAKLGKKIPLPTAAKAVAAKWIEATVGRSDLVTSWRLTAPEMRQGMTLKEWKTGNIPVVPYPVGKSVGGIVRINWSRTDSVSFEVTLVPKQAYRKQIKAQDFFINLRPAGSAAHRRWLVSYWAPRAIPPVPDASSSH